MTHRDKIWRRLENHTHFKGVPLNSIDDYERYFNDFGVSMVSVENVLEKGRAFGELGILYKTQRMADIICKYDCLIAKVSKERYTKIIGDEGERKIARTL
jgi:CRP-like cAMP-binding protein